MMLSAAGVPARAEDAPGKRPASLARYFPRQDLVVYAEFEGLDAHTDLWRKTAAYRLLNETTTGAMLEDLIAQLLDRAANAAPGRALTGGEWLTMVLDVARSGVAFAIVRAPDEPRPRCIGLVLRNADQGRLRAALRRLLDANGGRGKEAQLVEKPGGRKVTVVENEQSQGFAWWFEGDDLALCLGPLQGVDVMIDCLEGRSPSATSDPTRAALAAAGSGFTPAGLAFFELAALPPLPPQAEALGLDGIERIDFRWGFDGAALRTVTRVIAPAPRSGLLALLDQPAFDRQTMLPLPPGLAGFTAFSLAPDTFYDRLAAVAGAMDPEGEAAFQSFERTVRRATGLQFRQDILAHLGPRMAFYVVPTRINAPTNPLEGLVQGVAHVPRATLVIELKDRGRFARTLDRLVAAAQDFLRDQALAPPQTPAAEIRRLEGFDHGYVLSVPTALLPLPAGLRPTILLGKRTLILGSTTAAARAALALEDGPGGLPAGDPLAPALHATPDGMIFVSVADTRQSLLPEVVANLPALIQLFGNAAVTGGPPGVARRKPGDPGLAVNVDPDLIPEPDALRPFLFPGSFALGRDDQGFQFVSRESFPSVNPVTLAPVAVALLLPAVQSARTAARRAQSINNLKQIGLALHNYHSVNDRFPPQAIAGRDGKPLLSWRVAILPFLEQQALFDEFQRDEPWDSPHNKKLLERMPTLYAIPGAPAGPGMTFYRGFSGEGTFFDPKVKLGVPIASITDGTSNTLGIVEAREAVPWTRPDAEIAFDPTMKPEKAAQFLESTLGSHFPGGFNALFLDGSVRFLKRSINPQVLKALITRNGGEVISADSF
jgi:prepilin-type processing-associated H-X9-DG protein